MGRDRGARTGRESHRFLPTWCGVPENEVTIDLMRRYQEVESGHDGIRVRLHAGWAKGQGYESFSLGLSTPRGVGEKADDPRWNRRYTRSPSTLGRFYNFGGAKRLQKTNSIHAGSALPRYPGSTSLPAVLVHPAARPLWG